MKIILIVLAAMMLIAGCSLNVNDISHDEQKAISITNQFFLNIINNEYALAYENQFSNSFKKNSSLKSFETFLEQEIRKNGAIHKARFDYFQPVPGEKMISLYYVIEQKKVQVVYNLVLEGDNASGYKIIWIGLLKKNQKLTNPKMGQDIFAEVTAKGINIKGQR